MSQIVLALMAVCLLCYTVSAQQETIESCAEKVAKLREEAKDGRAPQDMEYPLCDNFGNYEKKQCFGLWTGHGACYCVDVDTGARYPDMGWVKGRSMKGQDMTCQCAKDNETPEERTKECELDTGDYKTVTCTDAECYCTHRAGGKMHGYNTFQRGESNCICARLAYPSIPGKTIHCDSIGRFKPSQCHGSMCFCVDEFGEKTSPSVPIGSNEHRQLNCGSNSL